MQSRSGAGRVLPGRATLAHPWVAYQRHEPGQDRLAVIGCGSELWVCGRIRGSFLLHRILLEPDGIRESLHQDDLRRVPDLLRVRPWVGRAEPPVDGHRLV